jgi:hypothetical protein
MKQSHRFTGAILTTALLTACGGNGVLSSSIPTGVMPNSSHSPTAVVSFKLAATKTKPEFVLDLGGVTGNLYIYQVTESGNALIGVMRNGISALARNANPSRAHADPRVVNPADTEYAGLHPANIFCNAFKWIIILGLVDESGGNGTLLDYSAEVKNGELQIKYVGSLQQSSSDSGPGLAADNAGNLYASNANSDAIDVFTTAEVKSGSGTPVRTIHTKLLTEVFWLATAGKKLLADGLDKSGNYDVTEVNVKTGADKFVNQQCASRSSGTCSPGGMVVGPRPATMLYVNNKTNKTISAFAPPWTGAPVSSATYPSTDLIEAVALDTQNNLLWGGNQDQADGFSCGSKFYDAADNLGFSLPLKSIQASTPPYGACVSGVPQWDFFSGTATTSMFKT